MSEPQPIDGVETARVCRAIIDAASAMKYACDGLALPGVIAAVFNRGAEAKDQWERMNFHFGCVNEAMHNLIDLMGATPTATPVADTPAAASRENA